MTRPLSAFYPLLLALAALSCSVPEWQYADRRTSFNQLRIYQIMVEAYADGDSTRGYGSGWGPSDHLGDLRGITDQVPQIAVLGVNAIWLAPIFDSDRHADADDRLDATGYFARDYFRIDPEFGSLQDARELVDTAHAHGLYVFLDGVFGHHKADVVPSPTGRLPAGPDNPVDYPGSLDFYTEVALYWIDVLNIDGWRLDQAYQVPPGMWRQIRGAVEEHSRQRARSGHAWGTLGYMVAEVWRSDKEIARDAYGPPLSPALLSAFDFPMRYRLVQTLAVEESGRGEMPASNLAAGYETHASYPPHAVPTFMLSNHDLVRFGDLIERAGFGGPDTEQYWARLRCAHSFLAAYTGPITLYYGEETGDEMAGFDARVEDECWKVFLCDDHVGRTSGRFSELAPEAAELRQYVASLMRARARHSSLWNGARQSLVADETLFVDLKVDGRDRVLYLLNTGANSRRVVFPLTELGARQFSDAVSQAPVAVNGDSLVIDMDGLSARFVALTD